MESTLGLKRLSFRVLVVAGKPSPTPYMFIRPRAVAAASITIGSQKPSKSYLYTIEAELF